MDEEKNVNVQENIQPQTSTNSYVQKTNNGLATASFVLSLVGLVIFGIICGVLAVIFGILAMSKINPETEKNKWMAITGIAVGVVDVVFVFMSLPALYNSLGIF